MRTDDKRIRAEAAVWVHRTSQLHEQGRQDAEFERWMNASPAHRAAFADMTALWGSDALAEAAIEVASSRRVGRRRLSWRLAIPSALAATACAVAALCIPWIDYRILDTERGETRIVALADGSTVHLNGGARLSVRQAPLWRSASLQRGEAHFEVRHDGRPFTVDTGEGVVHVLGTAFNVDRLERERAEVTLYRGAVRLRTRSGQVFNLAPGDRVMLENGRFTRVTSVASVRPDWTDGWFDAEDTTLGRLVAEIDRFSKTPVSIDAEASRIPVSGRFRLSPPEAALALIAAAYDVDVETTADGVTVHARQPARR